MLRFRFRFRFRTLRQHTLRAIGLRQGPHQIQLLALLVRVDGRSLVVVDQLVQGVELALSDAVHVLLHVHAEVLVASRCL